VRTFREVPAGTELCDTLEYELPCGILGKLADRVLVGPRIRRMFAFRQAWTRELIESGDYRQTGD
jgi:ligand-binding SRPBCC domain-containing protein